MAKNIFLPLESLRGFAAVSVALFHFNVGSSFNNSFTNNAGIMVDFFFVLSGFVIALSYMEKIKNCNDLVSFQKKRFWRLYPLHMVMLLIFVLLEFIKDFLTTIYGIEVAVPAWETNNLNAFFANVFLIHDWVLPYKTFNAPSWSISAEFFTYAIFAVLLFLTYGRRKLLITTLIVSIIIFGIFISSFRFSSDEMYGPLRCLYCFFIGALFCCFFDAIRNKIVFSSSIPSLIFLLATILMVSLKEYLFYEVIPIIFGITILFLVLTDENQTINKILSNSFFVYLGTISYGIYMIHLFVWQTIIRIQRFILDVPTEVDSNGAITLVYGDIFIADFVTLLGITVTIFLAHLSYKYVETRFSS